MHTFCYTPYKYIKAAVTKLEILRYRYERDRYLNIIYTGCVNKKHTFEFVSLK